MVGTAEQAYISVNGNNTPVQVTLSSSTLTLAATGQAGDQSPSQRTTVTVTVPPGTPAGTYTVYINGQAVAPAGVDIGIGTSQALTIVVAPPTVSTLARIGFSGSTTVAGNTTRSQYNAATIQPQLNFANTSNVPVTYSLVGTGTYGKWVQTNPAYYTNVGVVKPGAVAGMNLNITVPFGTPAGTYTVTYNLVATSAAGVTTSTPCSYTITLT